MTMKGFLLLLFPWRLAVILSTAPNGPKNGVLGFIPSSLPLPIGSSTFNMAKKIKDFIPESVLETEVGIPGIINVGEVNIDVGKSIADLEAWRDQAALEYPNVVGGYIRTALDGIKAVADEELQYTQIQQWRVSASPEYKQAISVPFQKVATALDQAGFSDFLQKSGDYFNNIKQINSQQLAPTYKEAISKLTAEETYAGAKIFNERALTSYNQFLTKTFSSLSSVNGPASQAIAEAKVNNEQIVKGYNGFITQLNSNLVQPILGSAKTTVEVVKETNKGLPSGYNSLVTGLYNTLDSVAFKPAVELTKSTVTAAQGPQNNLVSSYNEFVTTIYLQGAAQVSKIAQPLVKPVIANLDGIDIATVKADALVSYHDFVTKTYNEAGPFISNLLSQVQTLVENYAMQ